MTMSKIRWRFALAILSMSITSLGTMGCQPVKSPAGVLPPAYTSNMITDPALVDVAEGIKNWGEKQVGADQKPLYSRIEVLTPVPIVQPYGVGVFQQEVRLPAIFTTGPGWSSLTPAEKEAAVINDFNHLSSILKDLKREPPLQPTLTVQTPQGMELAWLNRVEPNGKNVHGDD
jgi:hypothetical protein